MFRELILFSSPRTKVNQSLVGALSEVARFEKNGGEFKWAERA